MIKFENEIDFIENYWKVAKKIGVDFKKHVEDNNKNPNLKNAKQIGKFLQVVNFSDLSNWDICKNSKFNSLALIALSEKINHMILTNKGDSIKRMLDKIVTGRLKKLKQPIRSKATEFFNKESEYLGVGSFRWDRQAYTLNESEIKLVKEYFYK